MHCSRRSALRCLGAVAGLTATAGCLDFGSSSGYTLIAQPLNSESVGAEFLVSDPGSVAAETRIDIASETKQQYIADLFEHGQVTVLQWPLVPQDQWSTTRRTRPTFLHRDGTYYEVTVTNERFVDRDRWLFAVERVDSNPPDDARVGSEPFNSLSARDRQILHAALDAIHADADEFLGEPAFDDLQPVQFHHDISVEESALVPSPPFDYVQAENEYFRVVTEQRIVSVPEWTFSVEPVADSSEAFETYAREAVPDARLRTTDLSADASEVLHTAVTDGPYEEDDSLSDGLSEVFGELGIAKDLQPLDAYEEQTAFRWVIASYDDAWYRFDLQITP